MGGFVMYVRTTGVRTDDELDLGRERRGKSGMTPQFQSWATG